MLHWLGVTGEYVIAPGERFWYRTYVFGYEACETLEVDSPRRIVHRGLFTRRLRIWNLWLQTEGALVRVITHRGSWDEKWENYLKIIPGAWSFVLECLRAYLEGRFDLQEMPYFGVRTQLVKLPGAPAHTVTYAASWAKDAGVQVDDRLLAINGEPLTTDGLTPFRLRLHANEIVVLTLQRGVDTLQTRLRLPSWRRVAEIQGADVGPPPGWKPQ